MPRIRPAPARAARLTIALWLLLALAPYLASYREVGFLSEDFTVLVYSSDLARAASDFHGAQYALEQPRFYRPWVSLSIGLESALFGFSPFLLKLSNLGLFAAGLLAFRALALRLGCGAPSAAFAGLLCAWFPFGAGSVLWMVGRVDAHLFGFGMAFLALHARAFRLGERATELAPRLRSALAAAACLTLALLTKETAIALAPIAIVLDLLRGGTSRWTSRLLRLAPCIALTCAYVLWRARALGVWIGGYAGGADVPDAWENVPAKLAGLIEAFGAMWLAGPRSREGVPEFLGTGGAAISAGVLLILLLAAAVWRLARRDMPYARIVAAGIAWALLAALPLVQLWGDPAFATNARVYLVAWAGVALSCAAALRALPRALAFLLALGTLAIAAGGLSRNLSDHVGASRAVEALRARVIEAADARRGRPAILHEVPAHVGSAYALAFGLREALRPPFAPFACEVAAWRALFPASPPLPRLAAPIDAAYGDGARARDPRFASGVSWSVLRGAVPEISGEEAFAWFASWQALQGADRAAQLAALPTLELPGFGPRVRLAFLSGLGSAAGEIALPPEPRPALSIFEVFAQAPILESGEGAIYVPLEVLDKGGDRIWMYAESLDERREPNGPVTDLLELRFTPSFRAMMRVR